VLAKPGLDPFAVPAATGTDFTPWPWPGGWLLPEFTERAITGQTGPQGPAGYPPATAGIAGTGIPAGTRVSKP